MVAAVAIVLAIGFVVLLVVAHEIMQGEAVMSSDKIDRSIRSAPTVTVQVAGTGQAVGEFVNDAALSFPVGAHHVAVFAVPFSPAHRKIANLVTPPAQVPGRGGLPSWQFSG